jgi:hypothetical protein
MEFPLSYLELTCAIIIHFKRDAGQESCIKQILWHGTFALLGAKPPKEQKVCNWLPSSLNFIK